VYTANVSLRSYDEIRVFNSLKSFEVLFRFHLVCAQILEIPTGQNVLVVIATTTV